MDLDWLTNFDVISRVTGLMTRAKWQAQRRRKHHRKTKQARGSAEIVFTPPAGQAAMDVERMLKRYGVPATDRKRVSTVKTPEGVKVQTFALHVPASMEIWARYLMQRDGVTLDGAPEAATEAMAAQTPAGATMPAAWADGGERWESGKMSWGRSRRHSGTRTSGGSSSKSSRSGAFGRMFRRMW